VHQHPARCPAQFPRRNSARTRRGTGASAADAPGPRSGSCELVIGTRQRPGEPGERHGDPLDARSLAFLLMSNPAPDVVPHAYQSEIYLAGLSGNTPALPTDLTRWQALARRKLEQRPYGYVAGGAGTGATMRGHRRRWTPGGSWPRMLPEATGGDWGGPVLGTELPAPAARPVGCSPSAPRTVSWRWPGRPPGWACRWCCPPRPRTPSKRSPRPPAPGPPGSSCTGRARTTSRSACSAGEGGRLHHAGGHPGHLDTGT